jgi:hypothetical protein
MLPADGNSHALTGENGPRHRPVTQRMNKKSAIAHLFERVSRSTVTFFNLSPPPNYQNSVTCEQQLVLYVHL